MAFKHTLRNLIIGKERYITTRSDYKSTLLRGELSILGIAATMIYIMLDLLNHIYLNIPIYLTFTVIMVLSFIANRAGMHLLTNIIQLFSGNLIIYLFAASDSAKGSVFILFVTISIAAFGLFGYRQRAWAMVFVCLSFCLFLLAYFVDFSILERPVLTEGLIKVKYFFNFTIAFTASVLIIFLLVDINHHSENTLKQKEENLIQLTEELKKSRQRYEMAITGSKAGIYEWERSKCEIFISPYYQVLLGYNPGELNIRKIEDYQLLIHPEDQPIVHKAMSDHFATQQPFHTELRLKTKNGEYKWFSDSGQSVFNEQGESLTVVGSIFDINERKKAEQQVIEQNILLAKTNAELDRFVYSTSHDLRAPLSSVLGLISIAKKTQDPEEVRHCLTMMKERIHHLEEFIHEIIDYSRNARIEVKRLPTNLYQLINDVVENLRHAEGSENIFVKYDIPKDLDLKTDESRLKVVLNNLIGNSIKYSDIEKENQFISVKTSQGQDRISIFIEDNGVGISQEHHSKIFDMFYRASEKSQGSGLGLYIVRETVHKLGGDISFESIPGKGTTFEIVIPS
jgi:PAS domain S-box-containing protein